MVNSLKYYLSVFLILIIGTSLPLSAQTEITADSVPFPETLTSFTDDDSFLYNGEDSIPQSDFFPSPEEEFYEEGPFEVDSLEEQAFQDSVMEESDGIYGPVAAVSDSALARRDTVVNKPKDLGLTAVVEYEATDSLIFSASGSGQLFNEAHVTYGVMDLTGAYIRMNMDSSTIYSKGIRDSMGVYTGNPVFKDVSGEYESRDLMYNFVTQKGVISQVVTQQGEGYVVSGRTKKMADGAMYMTDGKYTTCENKDHPHFYLALSEAKVRPGKNIVTGPAHLVMEDVHLPLVVPFGFFPFSSEYSSGIITPTYGDELSRGFYLKDGGYYFAISDYLDLALTGEIYSKGSWGVQARSSYRKRYKYSGSLRFSYLVTANSERRLPDYSESNNMSLVWSHSQDTKANPYRSFSASVNFATSGFARNDLNSYYNPEAFSSNTKSSTINLTQRFPNFPLNISASASVSQRSKDSTLTVALPNMSFSVSRFYPFKRKNAVGKERFYEKISMSYSGTLANSISEVKESEFFQKSLIKDWRNGMKHSIPVSATFNVFDYINVTPSFNYTERWYTNSIDKYYDETGALMTDTVWGFNRVWDYSASLSASTKLYGFYQPLPIFGTKINMIRHVITPTVSLSYRPDFGLSRYGYYETIGYLAEDGTEKNTTYSHYQGSLYGSPSSGKSGTVSFSVANNLEMKVRNDRDTTEDADPFRKISLIDNFSFSTSYNMAADSLNWSNISANIRLKLSPKYTLNLSGTFDPYTYQLNSSGQPVRVNVTQFEKNHIPGRLISTGTSFSYTLNNDTFKKKDKEAKDKNKGKAGDVGLDDAGLAEDAESAPAPEPDTEEKSGFRFAEDEYYKPYTLPWSLSISYTLRYARADFNKETLEYNRKLTHNLSFNGNISITDQWRLNFSSGYNFDTKSLSMMNCSVSRDLHCWTLSANFIPIGPYKSYNFCIRVKSGMLQDLKYEQRQNPRDNVVWGVR